MPNNVGYGRGTKLSEREKGELVGLELVGDIGETSARIHNSEILAEFIHEMLNATG